MRCPLLLPVLACLVPLAPAHAANPVVRFETVLGSFDVELCAEISDWCAGVAPATVANFLRYVDEDVYPPTTFIHRRALAPQVIQGGGYFWNAEADPMPGADNVPAFDPIDLEVDPALGNVRGSIAMARLPDPDTATNQWFVNLIGNAALNGQYAVFGFVIEGLDVVDAIGDLPRYNFGSPFNEIPLIDFEQGVTPVQDTLVYVTRIERVPEPGETAAAIAAAGALLALRRRSLAR